MEQNFTLGASLKTFKQLVNAKKIKELREWLPKKTLAKYDNQGLVPHYVFNGKKAYKVSEVINWIKEELVECYDGFKIISKFYSFSAGIKKPKVIPNELMKHSEELIEFPICTPSCVYFLLDNIEIVYIGQSINLANRISQHMLVKDFNKVLYLPVPQENLLSVERFFIEHLTPKYNNEAFLKHRKFMYKDRKLDEVDMLINGAA